MVRLSSSGPEMVRQQIAYIRVELERMKTRRNPALSIAVMTALSSTCLVSATAQSVSFSAVSGNGYATGDINSCATGRNALVTSGSYQYCAYFDSNRYLNIARRNLSSSTWTNGRTNIQITAAQIADDHNNVAIAIDGDGYLHTSWGMHNIQIQYARSTAPVTGATWGNTQAAALTTINSITGANENSVTYPEFINVPGSKDLLFIHRNGASGGGNEYISRWTSSTTGAGTWTRLSPTLVDGLSTSVNGYLNNLQYDSTGKLLMTWVWRGTPAFQTNHNIMYAESTDNGVTWKKQGGAAQALPITEANAQIVKVIPDNSSLINQTTMTVDQNNYPMVATWYAPQASSGEHGREYMLEWYNGTSWQTSQITNRAETKTAPIPDSIVRETGRPIVLVDDDNRVIVLMRQNEDANRIVAAYSKDRVNWDFVTLNNENMGIYEPTYDRILWERDNRLNLFYQPVGLGAASSTVSVMEWDVAAFFGAAGGVHWTQNGNGTWSSGGNWNGAVPNAVSAIARFGGGTTNFTVSPTVTVDGTRAVGSISFDHGTQSFNIAQGASGLLALNNGASPASVRVLDGTHTIATPMSMTSAGAKFEINGQNDTLIVAASITGTGTITKSGSGVLAFGLAGDTTLANPLVVSNGSIRQQGSGVLTLTGNNSFAGGSVAASSGTIRRGSAGAFVNGMGLVLSGTGRIDLNGFALTVGTLSGDSGVLTDDSTTPGTTQITFSNSGIANFGAAINDGAVRKVGIIKNSNDTLQLRGNSNFSGGTALNQGYIEVYHNNALGTGTVTLNSGANNARVYVGDGISVTAPMLMTTSNPAVLTGSIQSINNTSTGTYSGAIQINANSTSGGHFMGPMTSGRLNIAGPVTTGGSATFLIIREGFMRFFGGGSYPELQIRASTTSIGANNGIATNAVIDLGGNGSTTVATNFDLNGFNQTLAGLKNAVTNTNAAVVTNSSGTLSTLTFANGNTTQSFGGSVQANLSVKMQSGTQILTKSGTTGLNGVYNYTGATIVNGGTLQLASMAWNPVLNLAGGAEVNGGKLVFDYTGAGSPQSTIVPMLQSSYALGYTGSARFRSSIDPGTVGLRWTDDGSSKFTVMAALFGDANLDERVTTTDFNILAGRFGQSGGWTFGDFNLSGNINSVDFVLLAGAYGKTFPAPATMLGSAVPEPASLGAISLIGALACRRRSRR